MATLGGVPCPGRCGGRIRIYATRQRSLPHEVEIDLTADSADVRRHALCMAPPPDGEAASADTTAA